MYKLIISWLIVIGVIIFLFSGKGIKYYNEHDFYESYTQME